MHIYLFLYLSIYLFILTISGRYNVNYIFLQVLQVFSETLYMMYKRVNYFLEMGIYF